MRKIIYSLLVILTVACGSSGGGEVNPNPDSFNRKEMLTFWADQMIIPAYKDFEAKASLMKEAVSKFTNNATEANLTAARTAWKNAYVSWQKASLFQVGKAQEVNMVGSMNTIPTSVTQLNSYATSGTYNLTSPNLLAVQGFPALDYLLNGQGTDAETITFYTTATNAGKYKTYLNDVANRAHELTKSVYDNWKGSYRQSFIDNDGYSISSSVDKLVNFYVIPFYEKQLRDPKIANPSGAKTGTPDPALVEGYYKKDISKELFIAALTATKNFFKGIGYNGTSGKSLQQYLEFLNRKDLADLINTKFADVEQKATALDNDFASQIQSNKIVFLTTYDSMQSLLKSFKPDMMSAMSIKNTSSDADND